jgi:hypothetical protein
MREAGFQEVRLTGGEPLVFDNLSDMAAVAHQAGLRIALLTNGIKIMQQMDWILSETGPHHVTVSIHSLGVGSGVFGTIRDQAELLAGLRVLIAAGIDVTCTFVSDPRSMEQLGETIARLSDIGVSDYKVIRANVPGSSAVTFNRMLRRIVALATPYGRVRMSDNGYATCMLPSEGTLSVILPELTMVPCCATVGGAAFEGLRFDAQRLPEQLSELRRSTDGIIDPPCDAHYGACPIALRTVTQGDSAGTRSTAAAR